LITSVPDLTNCRAAAMPLSKGPSAVRRRSISSDFAPDFVRSVACFLISSTEPFLNVATRR
jgi:hypothetical protein